MTPKRYNKDITIALTSCGRYGLLKKTVHSLSEAADISGYRKILTEDSLNEVHKSKIRQAKQSGFLKDWEVIFTNGSKQHGALISLYEDISSPYVFHCEEDWNFQKSGFDFIRESIEILERHPDIWIVLLRDLKNDGGLEKLWLTKEERAQEIFSGEKLIYNGRVYAYTRTDEGWDPYFGFSYNPGLRRTPECKKVMFGYEKEVNEIAIGIRYRNAGLRSVYLEPGNVTHMGNSILSTKIISLFDDGIIRWLYRLVTLTLKCRTEWALSLISEHVFKTYKFADGFRITRYLMDQISWVRRRRTPSVPESYLSNREWFEEYNIPKEWFTQKKPFGLSWVARLKNGDDFLKAAIESHLPYLDELVLVDNGSDDATWSICKEFANKYPNKIKAYQYPYDIRQVGDSKSDSGADSVHSIAYYYNWAFSKSTYQYVMKVDDDNILIPEVWEKIRKKLESKPDSYLAYWGYNLMAKGNEIGICETDPYSGKLWDHGVYKVTEKTYYVQEELCEGFMNNLKTIRLWHAFWHLKYLKKDCGFTNCKTPIGIAKMNSVKNSWLRNFESFHIKKDYLEILKPIRLS